MIRRAACGLLIAFAAACAPAHAQTAPAKVSAAAITHRGGVDQIVWNAVAGADTYTIRFRTQSPLARWQSATHAGINFGGTNCAEVSLAAGCKWVFASTLTLFAGAAYEVQVAAVNSAGTGAWSDIASGDISGEAATAPGAPTAVVVTPGDDQLALTWTAPAGSVTAYRVRWRVTGSAWRGWVKAANPADAPVIGDSDDGAGAGDSTAYTIAALQPGTSYAVAVAAVNEASLSAWTQTLTETSGNSSDATLRALTVSAAAISFQAQTETYSAQVANTVSTVSITPAANHHAAAIKLQLNAGAEQTLVSAQASAAQSLQVGANTLRITVTAEDGGTKMYTLTITRAAAAPSPPQNFAVTRGDAMLTLTWSAPASDGGAAITSYRYRWSNDGDESDWESAGGADGIALAAAVTLPYEIAGLPNGATYAVQVGAHNAVGVTWSASQNARPLGAPGAPRNIAAVAGVTTLQLSWDAPAETGGARADELQYDIRWREFAAQTWQPAVEVAAGVRAYLLENLTAETGYAVSVRAKSGGGASGFAPNPPVQNAQTLAPPFTLDLGAGESGAGWEDAIVAARYAAGIEGDAMLAGLTFAGTAAEVKQNLDDNRDALDVDAETGVTLRDAILIVRYALGVRDDSLFAGQVTPADTAAKDAIIRKIEAVLPP